ncbi:hypothetical protein AZSP09_25160 [Azospira sp. I09]|nr:hypothetical protein AZSP09_25160 [Azospira sp. I09]
MCFAPDPRGHVANTTKAPAPVVKTAFPGPGRRPQSGPRQEARRMDLAATPRPGGPSLLPPRPGIAQAAALAGRVRQNGE